MVCLILCVAVLIKYRLETDRHTDRHTQTNGHDVPYTAQSIGRAVIRQTSLTFGEVTGIRVSSSIVIVYCFLTHSVDNSVLTGIHVPTNTKSYVKR